MLGKKVNNYPNAWLLRKVGGKILIRLYHKGERANSLSSIKGITTPQHQTVIFKALEKSKLLTTKKELNKKAIAVVLTEKGRYVAKELNEIDNLLK